MSDRIKEHLAVAAAVVGRHHDARVVVDAVLAHPVEPRSELHREGALGQVVAVVVVGMGLTEVRGRSRLRERGLHVFAAVATCVRTVGVDVAVVVPGFHRAAEVFGRAEGGEGLEAVQGFL